MINTLSLKEGKSCLMGTGGKRVCQEGGLKCLRDWKKGNASLHLQWGQWVGGREAGKVGPGDDWEGVLKKDGIRDGEQ